MKKISPRKLITYAAAAISSLLVWFLLSQADSPARKAPDYESLHHGPVFQESRNSVPQSPDAQRTNSDSTNQAANIRPPSCNGCFQTHLYPTLIDEPDLCKIRSDTPIDMVFFIVSAHNNTGRRSAVRNTWASVTRNNTSNFRYVFVMGKSTYFKQMETMTQESDSFHDVVAFGFPDTYKALTLKVVCSLRWLTSRCQHARFFVKVNDDTWINTAAMMPLLNRHSDFLQRGIVGNCFQAAEVDRNVSSKRYVTEQLYPEDRYPPYCQGHAYASSLSVAKEIVDVSPDVPMFFFDDIYVGMCLTRLGFGAKSLDDFSHLSDEDICRGHSRNVSAIADVAPNRMIGMWRAKCPNTK